MTALASQPKPSPLADTARRVISATVDVCHKYNDFTDRAWEIGWLHSVFDDDTLLNDVERQQFKAWIIDREMRPKSGNFTEVFNAVLNIAEITGIVSSGKVMKLPKLTPSQRLDFKRALDKLNKAPYDPRTMEKFLKSQHPDANIASSTLPKTNDKNVKFAGMRHDKTKIVFNNRGLPVYDDIAKVDLMLKPSVVKIRDRKRHFMEATKELSALIDKGVVDKNIFTEKQLQEIRKFLPEITDLTWHHHENIGRMQLVSRVIHRKTGHVGGFDLWYK